MTFLPSAVSQRRRRTWRTVQRLQTGKSSILRSSVKPFALMPANPSGRLSLSSRYMSTPSCKADHPCGLAPHNSPLRQSNRSRHREENIWLSPCKNLSVLDSCHKGRHFQAKNYRSMMVFMIVSRYARPRTIPVGPVKTYIYERMLLPFCGCRY